MEPVCDPKELYDLLMSAIPAKMPVLITGSSGIGKSDIVSNVAESLGYDYMVSYPGVSEPTDFRGLPWPDADKGAAEFLPFSHVKRALDANSPLVWFLDDLGQAPSSVQAVLMQLLLARQVNDRVLSDHVVIVSATNRRSDRAGVGGMLTPVISRMNAIVELKVDVDRWIDWALVNGISESIIGFIRFRPDLLNQFDPRQASEMKPYPCPRTWAFANRWLDQFLPESLMKKAISGAIGESAAHEFFAYLDVASKTPDVDAILEGDDSIALPDEVSVLYAVSAALASRVNKSNVDGLIHYCNRLDADGRGEFAAYALRDSARRDPSILGTRPMAELAGTRLGQLISGA